MGLIHQTSIILFFLFQVLTLLVFLRYSLPDPPQNTVIFVRLTCQFKRKSQNVPESNGDQLLKQSASAGCPHQFDSDPLGSRFLQLLRYSDLFFWVFFFSATILMHKNKLDPLSHTGIEL